MTEIENSTSQLLEAITTRWRPQIERSDDIAYATWWYGVMQKCSSVVEELLDVCVKTLLSIAGDEGAQIARNIADGKSIDLLTLGQRIQLLDQLNEKISLALKQSYPEVLPQRRILDRNSIRVLQRISRIRNSFTHGRLESRAIKETTLEYLSCIEAFCHSRLITVTVAYQQKQLQQDATQHGMQPIALRVEPMFRPSASLGNSDESPSQSMCSG